MDEWSESQLSELDMLMSMFDCDSELQLDDPSAVADLRTLVESRGSRPSEDCDRPGSPLGSAVNRPQIGFTLKLQTEREHTIELVFRLPPTYPKSPPYVSVRFSNLPRRYHQQFNEKLQSFIRELQLEAPVIYEIIQWIKEMGDSFLEEYVNECNETAKTTNLPSALICNQMFSRLWIYSHHIYNKVKRKTILDLANDLSLTGFSVPGKPGIICVEGDQKDTDDFWQKIRAMQWKKISIVHRDDRTADDLVNFEKLRTFTEFEEKHFDPRSGKGREVHMDLGLLFQFLQEKGFADIFQLYFGIKGRESVQDDD